MTLERAYARELSRLRELGRAFAAAHPHSAGLLGERSADPDVERLLEGVAFIAAGLQGQIEASAGLTSRRLLESIMPHWVRPTPASTIVELRPALRTLRSIQRIAAGKELRARPPGGAIARFTTTDDVDLAPLELLEVRAEQASPTRGTLRITLRSSDAGAPLVPSLERLRLFVSHRDPAIAAALVMWIARYGPRAGPLTAIHRFADPASRLLPWPASTPPAIRALAEGLAYPATAGFVELRGLRGLALAGPTFSIEIAAAAGPDEPPLPPLPRALPPETLRLHCAPAVNLFAATGEPFEHHLGDRPHLLRVDGADPRHAAVFDVIEVRVGRVEATRRICGLLPGDRVDARTNVAGGDAHDADADPETPPIYAIDRGGDGDPGVVRLRLEIPTRGHRPGDAAVISTRLLATNGGLADGLGIGDLSLDAGHVLIERATNISAVTPPRAPPATGHASWHLADHLALCRRPLATLDDLRALLTLHLGEAPERRGGLLDRRTVDALRGLRRARILRVDRGVATPVLATTVEVDARALTCVAEAELLGALLDRLFAAHTDAASASALTLVLQPAGDRLTWPLRGAAGDPDGR